MSVIFAWHKSHDVLVQPVWGGKRGIQERVADIKANKPAHEIPTRLRLFKRVKGKLPTAVLDAGRACDDAEGAYKDAERAYDDARRPYVDAWRAYDDARRAYDDARRANVDAWRACDDVLAAHVSEIEALHRQECPDCPWDGKTIFPQEATP